MPLAPSGLLSRVCDGLAWHIRKIVGDARVDRVIVSVATRASEGYPDLP